MIEERFLEGQEASLQQLLLRREARVQTQQELLTRGGSLVSFSMNIPGQRKQFPLERESFQEGLKLLRQSFREQLLEEHVYSAVTGDEAMLRLALEAEQVKAITVQLEESHPLGRLWDMDVLDGEGKSLSRTGLGYPPRRCLICGEMAKECGRSRRHSYEELFYHAAGMMHDYFRDHLAQNVGRCAVKAVLGEVSVTPKPGLVDRRDSGSHTDMDFFTFVDSAAALTPWFPRFFQVGWDQEEDLFAILRTLGMQAEREMFSATGGVNTHKGLIFSMSILCGALGQAWREAFPNRPQWETVLYHASRLGERSLADFSAPLAETAGLRCYRDRGVVGIRGEAAAGFPAVFTVGLPTLKAWLDRSASLNDAAVAALLALMSRVTDTNMIRRGGYEEAERRKKEAAEILARLTAETAETMLQALNQDYIRNHLSPGGCADLLALTLFAHFLEP